MKKIIPFFRAGYESNSYLIVSNGEAALIDAGVSSEAVLSALSREGATLRYILLTHGHFDHTLNANDLRLKTGAKLLIHKDDEEMLTDASKSALLTFFGKNDTVGRADGVISDGDEIALGNEAITVLHTKGHSKGSVCYQIGDSLFTGDTLFKRGYGRFDLYGGDPSELLDSLKRLSTLDGGISIYPGHGESGAINDAINALGII